MRIQRWTLVVVCAATAMLMLDIAVVNTALSRIAEDLHTGLSGLQWVVDAYTLALASTVLSAGFLADRLGRRRMFTIGLSLFTLASLACGLAGDITMLNAARAVQGIGAAIMFAVSLALLAHAFPDPKERAGAFAAYGAAIGASFAIGPLAGGLLTSGLDWQWVFLVNLPIGVFCLWITRKFVQESRDPHSQGIDWLGQITLTAGLFALVLALLRGNEQGWTSTPIVLELIGAAVALAAFVVVESRVAAPMLPLRFFRDRSFTGAQIGAFAISGSFFAAFLYVTLYLQQILGLSAIEAGLVYLPGTLVMLVVSGATAQLGARVPARTMISVGLALVVVGMVLFTLPGPDSSWWILMPGLIIACTGTGLFNPAMSNVALSVLSTDNSGVAAGANDTFRQAGIAVGVAALGALIPAQNALGGGSAADYVNGLHDAMWAGAALAAIGAIATAVLISRRFGTGAEMPAEAPTPPVVAELAEPLRIGNPVGAEA
jgi:EmrB/QacA subfamily drug resistance transporter